MVHQGLVETQVLFYTTAVFCVLSHVLLCNRTPVGWRSVFASKLAHFAITPIGYESLMVHQGLVETQVLFYTTAVFCVLSHALLCN